MKTKLINDGPQKTWALIFETGDEVMAGLKSFASEHGVGAAQFTAIGAFSEVMLGYFSMEKKDYKRIPVKEQVEVLSLIGDITRKGDEPGLHGHVVLGRSDGSTLGGHLVEATVRPTLEVIVNESPAHLQRKPDPETGLPLVVIED